MASIERRCLALGALLGAGLTLLMAGFLVYTLSSQLGEPSGIGNYTRLVALIEALNETLSGVNTSEVIAVYRELYNLLPVLRNVTREYSRVYSRLAVYEEVLRRVAGIVESREYQRLVETLDVLSRLPLVQAAGLNLTLLVRLARDAETLIPSLLALLHSAKRLEPRTLNETIALVSRIARILPPERLEELLNTTSLVLRHAPGMISAYRRASSMLRLARSASIALVAAGSALTGFSLVYLLVSRRS